MTEADLRRAAALLGDLHLQQRALRKERMAVDARLRALSGKASTAFRAKRILDGRGPRTTTPEERADFERELAALLSERSATTSGEETT